MKSLCSSALMAHAFWSVTAMAATLTYSGRGQVAPAGLPVGSELPLMVITPTTSYAFSDGRTWQLQALFTSDLNTGAGAGTFTFLTGADSLSGTIAASGNLATGQFLLSYTISGGTGSYQGFVGSGSGTVQLLGDPFSPPTPYSESGSLDVGPAPEPAPFALVALGLTAIFLRCQKPRVPAIGHET
jgi:hypothetical protein